MALPAISDLTLDPGTKRLMRSSSALKSAPTETSRVSTCLPCVSKKKALVWPTFLAIRNTRLEDWTTASIFSGSETSTSLSSKGNCTSKDLLVPSETLVVMGKGPRAGICSTEFCTGSPARAALWPKTATSGATAIPITASSNARASPLE